MIYHNFNFNFTDYARYPVYASPLTERMRKRKAFADSHLEASQHIITMSSFSPPPMTTFTANHPVLSAYTDPNPSATELLRNFVDYQLNERQQQQYQRATVFNECAFERISPSAHIENTNFEYSSVKVQRIHGINACENKCKPKLTFSIESIIGIK